MPGNYEVGVHTILLAPVGPRVKATLEEYAQRMGMPFSEYAKTRIGFMGALLALNQATGMRVYDVEEDEAFDESAIVARHKGPNFILDDQTHILFRKGGYKDISSEGSEYMEIVGDFRKLNVPGSQGVKELTKDTWLKEVFWESDTDVTFLNTLAWSDFFGGQDYFPTEECVEVAQEINSQYPGRVMTLGTVEPNQKGHLDKLEYYIKELKMDGLKLYPWDATSKRGWFCDDEKVAYPLWEKCLELGVDKIHIHKGMPVQWAMGKYVHPADVDQPLNDFPDLKFIIYHAGFPYLDEMTGLVKALGARPNLYAEIGGTFAIQVNTPVALAHTMGKLLKHIQPGHITWGTDAPIFGPPQWAIEALRKFTMPDELVAGYGYPYITDEDKEMIFGGNIARLYGLDVDKIKTQVKGDKLSQAKAAAGK